MAQESSPPPSASAMPMGGLANPNFVCRRALEKHDIFYSAGELADPTGIADTAVGFASNASELGAAATPGIASVAGDLASTERAKEQEEVGAFKVYKGSETRSKDEATGESEEHQRRAWKFVVNFLLCDEIRIQSLM